VPHGARLPQREKKKKRDTQHHTIIITGIAFMAQMGHSYNNTITIIFAAGERKKMTDIGIPEEPKKIGARGTRAKTRSTPAVFCFFF
jgi:hypothetical protein